MDLLTFFKHNSSKYIIIIIVYYYHIFQCKQKRVTCVWNCRELKCRYWKNLLNYTNKVFVPHCSFLWKSQPCVSSSFLWQFVSCCCLCRRALANINADPLCNGPAVAWPPAEPAPAPPRSDVAMSPAERITQGCLSIPSCDHFVPRGRRCTALAATLAAAAGRQRDRTSRLNARSGWRLVEAAGPDPSAAWQKLFRCVASDQSGSVFKVTADNFFFIATLLVLQ